MTATEYKKETDIKAAILRRLDSPLEICEVELTDLQVGQVLVRNLVSGICGSQLQEIAGNKGNGKFLPHLMGHEGVGIVEEIGAGVTRVKPGDKVVMHWRVGEGIEAAFPKYILNGKSISSGKVTTLSENSIVSENRLTPVPDATPNYFAALLGCGLTTALGIINIEADVKFGESVVIAGCGGVGLNLIQSAKLANAFHVIGLDIESGKESLAKKCGADFFVKSGSKELEEILAEYSTQKLIDVAIDTTGSATVIANLSTRLSNSGRLILVGQPKPGQSIELPNALDLFGTRGKSILTTQGGKTNPTMDIPRYVNLEKNGKLSVDSVVTHKFALSHVNEAFDVLRSGLAGRIMIEVANG